MKNIAVFYLARIMEGLPHFQQFAESYRQYPAGEDHELIIIYKGDLKSGLRAGAERIFDGIAHRAVVIPDEGYDIQAYLHTAQLMNHDTLCLFNTFTTLLSPNWLQKLFTQFRRPNIGVAGMTASYESIPSSSQIIWRAIWLTATKWVKFNRKLAKQFNTYLKTYSPGWLVADTSLFFRLRRVAGDLVSHRLSGDHPSLEADFARYWEELNEDAGALASFRDIPPFPNPHIRTNGFMLSREFLLEFRGLGSTKKDCIYFESGPDGLTNRAFAKGLGVVLVGADGIGYLPAEWPASKTFRLEQQRNLMASDNQVSAYARLPKLEREMLAYMTWGDYIGSPPESILDLRHKFTKRIPLITTTSNQRKPTISVVISTHNHLSLLKEAIYSVLNQKYQSWELVIFDNASTAPVKRHVDSLGQPRIRYQRSEVLLTVTDSWNRAEEQATGDYVIFLAPDDGLVPEFFAQVANLVTTFAGPDFIYSALYHFLRPGISPSVWEGYLAQIKDGFFFQGRTWPFLLKASDARAAWLGSVAFRKNFSFALPAFIFKRSFLDSLRVAGRVFHSPLPDHFLANLAMARGKSILVCPEPLTIAGVSSEVSDKSLFSNLEEKEGDPPNKELSQDPIFSAYEHRLLPGPGYLANYLVTMGHVAKNVPERVDPNPGIARYRLKHIFDHLQSQTDVRWLWNTEIGKEIWRRLKISERLWAVALTFCHFKGAKRFIRKLDLSGTAFTPIQRRVATGELATLPEAFAMLEQKRAGRSFALVEKEIPRKNDKTRRGASIRRR